MSAVAELRARLEAAHGRSRAAGVSVEAAELELRRIAVEAVERRSETAGTLLAVAAPHLRWLAARLDAVPHAAFLVDGDGIVLRVETNADELADAFGFRPGYDHSEAVLGTNAVGTALADDNAIRVIAADHFNAALSDIAAVAAPLRDPGGTPAGALAVATTAGEAAALSLDAVAHAAFAVELALRSGERSADMMDSALFGVFVADDARIVDASPSFLEMLGYTRADVNRGLRLRELTPPEHRLLDERALRAVLSSGHSAHYEKEFYHKDGTPVPVLVAPSLVSRDPIRWSCVVLDLSEPRRAEEAQRFLSEAGRLLAATLDTRQTIRTIGYLAVPRLADWCVVDLVEEDEIRTADVVHRDAARAGAARRLKERYPPHPDVPLGAYRVIRTGEALLRSRLSDADLESMARDGEHLRILGELGAAGAMIVPLTVRGVTLGAITFVTADPGRRYGEDDLVLADRLADRAALAIDNARLFEAAQAELRERERVRRALEQTNTRLNLLSDTATRLLTSEKPRDVVRSLFRRLSAELGLEVYFNYLVEETAGERRLRLDSWAGVTEERARQWEWLRFGEAVSGRVAESRQRVVAEEIDASDDPLTADLRAMGVTAYACHPLLAHGRLVGTLGLGTRARAAFESDELTLMQTIADQIAITLDRAALINELRSRAEDLAMATRSREELLAVVSHDLRNALNAILSYTNLMLQRPDGPEHLWERYLNGIRLAGRWMGHYIQDLLDVAQLEAGGLRIDPAPESVAELVDDAMTMLRPLAADREQTMTVALDEALPAVLVDRARFVQVLINLVGNAIKFTPDGGSITVRAGVDGETVRLEVEDTGPGIPPEDADAVFDRFWQGDATDRRGAGLGLAIAKRIVEAHGGRIGLVSRRGGTTFFFTLPLADA